MRLVLTGPHGFLLSVAAGLITTFVLRSITGFILFLSFGFSPPNMSIIIFQVVPFFGGGLVAGIAAHKGRELLYTFFTWLIYAAYLLIDLFTLLATVKDRLELARLLLPTLLAALLGGYVGRNIARGKKSLMTN